MAEAQLRVFVSYARADDELFVEQLHRDLEAAGVDVWWDRDTMASRGRTFLQEIRDAIEAVDRVIAVIGPGAVHSDYVRYEWEHAALFAKDLLPILRLGDYSLVPSELLPEDGQGLAASDLGRIHCPDFRAERAYEEALNELVAIIRQPVSPLASYDGTPALPPHFLPRRNDLRRLKETVLADVQRPTVIASSKQTAALYGMGGIGKSVLAAAFGRAIGTRRAMGDGILWLSAGQDATKLTLLNNMKAVGTAFGGAAEHYVDEVTARQHLPDMLADKVCLIILDDVWSIEQAEPFRDALGTRCRLLVTTRDGSLVTALNAQEHRVDILSIEQALALLADWSGQVPLAEARQVADECGNLPFALALCGAMARDGTSWPDLLDALQESDLTFIEARLPRYEFRNVLRALRVSVDMLGREDLAAVGRYHDLAVFSSDAAVPEAAVVTLWCRERGFSERNARKLLTTLGRKALLTVQGDSPHRRVSFHDLQHDYLRAIAGDGTATLHDNLINAYRSKCPGGWASGPNDGYFFQFLPYHLYKGGYENEIEALFSFEWLIKKLSATSIRSVYNDYNYTLNILIPNFCDTLGIVCKLRHDPGAESLILPVATEFYAEIVMACVEGRAPEVVRAINEWPQGVLQGVLRLPSMNHPLEFGALEDIQKMLRTVLVHKFLATLGHMRSSEHRRDTDIIDHRICQILSAFAKTKGTYYLTFSKRQSIETSISIQEWRLLARWAKQHFTPLLFVELDADDNQFAKETKMIEPLSFLLSQEPTIVRHRLRGI